MYLFAIFNAGRALKENGRESLVKKMFIFKSLIRAVLPLNCSQVSNMVGGMHSPYTFNIINYEKANSQFNFGKL